MGIKRHRMDTISKIRI